MQYDAIAISINGCVNGIGERKVSRECPAGAAGVGDVRDRVSQEKKTKKSSKNQNQSGGHGCRNDMKWKAS